MGPLDSVMLAVVAYRLVENYANMRVKECWYICFFGGGQRLYWDGLAVAPTGRPVVVPLHMQSLE